jgi:hypothetical protein
VRLGNEHPWSRERIQLDRLERVRQRVVNAGAMNLHDQMEEILGEVWRQEAWAETEDRIDVLVSQLRLSTR